MIMLDMVCAANFHLSCLFFLQDLVPVTEEVPVPFDMHRFIIGQKGRDVRRMMEEYDVNISIPPATESSDIVRVTGPPENVKKARAALEDKVAQLEAEKEDRVRDDNISIRLAGSCALRT